MHRLAARAGAALAGSLAAVLAILGITAAASDIPDAFTPLEPGSVISLTVIGVLLAVGLYALLERRSSDPARLFLRILPVALVLSLIPDVAIWASDAYEGTADAGTVVPLMLMHVAVAGVLAVTLPRRAERRAAAPEPA